MLDSRRGLEREDKWLEGPTKEASSGRVSWSTEATELVDNGSVTWDALR
jgi:hypothetical protein